MHLFFEKVELYEKKIKNIVKVKFWLLFLKNIIWLILNLKKEKIKIWKISEKWRQEINEKIKKLNYF